PKPGRALNQLFSARLFWIGVGGVFVIHNINALQPHFPTNIPAIPLTYDLSPIFSEMPWSMLSGGVKSATIFFTFIGVTYFIQTRVAFSLWATSLLVELYRVQLRNFTIEIPQQATEDQHLGAGIAFACGVLWIGRRHWYRIGCDLIGRSSDGTSYRLPAI